MQVSSLLLQLELSQTEWRWRSGEWGGPEEGPGLYGGGLPGGEDLPGLSVHHLRTHPHI